MTKESDIETFLKNVVDRVGDVDEGTHRMFRMLVEITLTYRDELHQSNQEKLTVSETQEALDGFMDVMKTHEIPAKLTPHAHRLIVLWLEEIKKSVHH
ncbi:MAG: hypothetical protein HY540_07850 [Deltaproteobacteria bacterium]|nr:hypothetical protein [Deltaproteobacteria bacterium]